MALVLATEPCLVRPGPASRDVEGPAMARSEDDDVCIMACDQEDVDCSRWRLAQRQWVPARPQAVVRPPRGAFRASTAWSEAPVGWSGLDVYTEMKPRMGATSACSREAKGIARLLVVYARLSGTDEG